MNLKNRSRSSICYSLLDLPRGASIPNMAVLLYIIVKIWGIQEVDTDMYPDGETDIQNGGSQYTHNVNDHTITNV